MRMYIALLALILCLGGCTGQEIQRETSQPTFVPQLTEEAPLHEESQGEAEEVQEEPEKSSRWEPIAGSRTVESPLWPGGPEIRVVFDYCENSPGDADVAVVVWDGEGQILQQWKFEVFCMWGIEYFPDNWELADINFDGYVDIICLYSVGGNRGNHFYQGWCYNAQTGLFEGKESFKTIFNPKIDSDQQVIRSSVTATASSYIHKIYQYKSGEYILTNQLDLAYFAKDRQDLLDTAVPDGAIYARSDQKGLYGIRYQEWEDVGGEWTQTIDLIECEEHLEWILERYYGSGTMWDLYNGNTRDIRSEQVKGE